MEGLKALSGNKQNLAGKFCEVPGELSDLQCLMNTLATITTPQCIKINTIIIITFQVLISSPDIQFHCRNNRLLLAVTQN